MTLVITTKVKDLDADTLVVGVDGSGRVPLDAEDLKEFYSNLIGNADDAHAAFNGKWGQTLVVPMPEESNYERVLLVGLRADKDKKTKINDWTMLGGKIYTALRAAGARKVLVAQHDKKSGLIDEHLARVAEGMMLGAYEFTKYKTKKADDKLGKLAIIGIDVDGDKKQAALVDAHLNVAAGVYLTRDLANDVPNYIYPETFAKYAEKELKPLGIKVEIFDEKDLAKHKMGGILGVGQGSARPPRMVIMRWDGGGKPKKGEGPIAFVGKGVTFDTGGINIKPSPHMEEMKFDMSGAAAVVGAMKAVALNKVKANVIGAVGLAENMPDGNAIRPSDILVSHAGKTVEVLNTDAEGRLVLMDVLSYVQKTYKPAEIVDLATLTGAIVIALGSSYAGAFVNNDKFWTRLSSAADQTGERLWRMPLDEGFRKAMEGSISDLQNLSSWDREGGSCTAAGFLEHFIEEGTTWAHLDIAATAYGSRSLLPGPKGSTGFGVRLLYSLVTAGR